MPIAKGTDDNAAGRVEATYKVGTNRGRPRIWIDGERLRAAGFIGGAQYLCFVGRGEMALVLPRELEFARGRGDCTPLSERRFPRPHTTRRVTGRPSGKPIVDIAGQDVVDALSRDGRVPERVRVTFSSGVVLISSTEAT